MTVAERVITDEEDLAPAVTDLRSPTTGRILGHIVGRRRPGPVKVVCGFRPVAEMAYRRICDLPSIGYMRGTMVLIYTDTVAAFEALEIQALDQKSADDILYLPFGPDAGTDNEIELHRAARDAYWTILSNCARLGMISGRGVLARPAV